MPNFKQRYRFIIQMMEKHGDPHGIAINSKWVTRELRTALEHNLNYKISAPNNVGNVIITKV